MTKLTPELQSFVQQWQLDNYEIETLLAIEWTVQNAPSKQEKEWKKTLKGFAQTQNSMKV